MSYLQGLINTSFKKGESDNTIFFPYGKFGKGYIVSTVDEEKVKKFLRRYYIISFIFLIIAILIFSSYTLLLAGILILWYYVRINKILNHTKETFERYQIRESMKIMSVSMGLPTCLALFLGSVLLLIATIVVFIRSDKMWGGLGMIFFGFASIVLFKMLIILIGQVKKKD